MTQQLTITRPDDWHLHVRDSAILNDVVPATAAVFGRAIIMPNLVPPVTTADQALAYRERIRNAAGNSHFEPLMTLYLTETTTPECVRQAKAMWPTSFRHCRPWPIAACCCWYTAK